MKNRWFESNLSKITRPVAAIKSLRFALLRYTFDVNINTFYRAGQDQGGPRWDTFTKESKSTKLLHIVLCYTQGAIAYDPVLLEVAFLTLLFL